MHKCAGMALVVGDESEPSGALSHAQFQSQVAQHVLCETVVEWPPCRLERAGQPALRRPTLAARCALEMPGECEALASGPQS
jgi:hypothetical protein